MNKLGIKKKTIVAIGSVVLVVAAFVSFGAQSYSKSAASDFDQTMYMEKLVSKDILKTYSPSKEVTRQEAAELLVRLYMKSKDVTIYALPQYDTLSDTDNLYAKISVLLKILKPSGKKFNPKMIITKGEFLEGLRVVSSGNAKFAKSVAKLAAGKPKVSVNDIGKLPKGLQSFIKSLANGRMVHVSPKGSLYPKGKLVEKDAFELLKKSNSSFGSLLNYKYSFKTRLVNGYKIPVVQSTDLMYTLGPKKEPTLFFPGFFDYEKGLGISDVNYQVIEAIKSGKIYKKADMVELLDYITVNWDSTAQHYVFSKDMYFKDGKKLGSKPSKPYICVKSGKFLEVQLSNTGLAK